MGSGGRGGMGGSVVVVFATVMVVATAARSLAGGRGGLAVGGDCGAVGVGRVVRWREDRAAGEQDQAEILNKVIDDMYWHKRVEIGRIRDFVGHTPIQVLVGSILGFALAILFY